MTSVFIGTSFNAIRRPSQTGHSWQLFLDVAPISAAEHRESTQDYPMNQISKLIARGCAVWLVLIGTESVHGILRTAFLAPRIGDFEARQVAVFTGSLLILAIAYVLVPWTH